MRLGPYFDPAVAPSAPDTPAVVPETPVAPVPDGDQPRDTSGRFTKANIEKAAGLVPDTPAVTPPATETPAPAAPVAPVPDALAAIDAVIQSSATPAIPTPEPVAAPQSPAQPAIPQTPEVMQVQQWAANPQQATEAIRLVRTAMQLDQAMNRGDAASVLSVFAPQAQDALKEHMFQTYRDEFAQRIIDEGNGVKQDPRFSMMERRLQTFEQTWQQEQQQRQMQTQQQQERDTESRTATAYNGFVEKLFQAAALSPDNRAWLEGRLNHELSRDLQYRTAVDHARRGNAQALQLMTGKAGAKFRELFSQFQPLLTAPAPAPTSAQPGSAQLMTAPAGTSTNSAPNQSLVSEDGGINTKNWGAKLKSMLKAV